MADTAYSNSEIEVGETASKELDFQGYWSDRTIEKEIISGVKLREQKIKRHQFAKEYHVVKVDHALPCPSAFGMGNTSTRKRILRSQSQARTIRSFKAKSTKKSGERCPIRIIELAVPSKRHILDTWRNKSHNFPGYMVHRLQQHIMDQKPIVEVAEAVTFLNMARKRNAKLKRSKKKIKVHSTQKEKSKELIYHKFGELFTTKMAEKLCCSHTVTCLNPKLKSLLDVVNSEISSLLRKKKETIKRNNRTLKIQQEMASKVAVWILSIMEDTSYKLLLEDLRELEEQEGPVLDILEDLIFDIVDKCNPTLLGSDDEWTTYYEDKYDGGNFDLDKPALQTVEPDNSEVSLFINDLITLALEKIGNQEMDVNETSIYSKEEAKNQAITTNEFENASDNESYSSDTSNKTRNLRDSFLKANAEDKNNDTIKGVDETSTHSKEEAINQPITTHVFKSTDNVPDNQSYFSDTSDKTPNLQDLFVKQYDEDQNNDTLKATDKQTNEELVNKYIALEEAVVIPLESEASKQLNNAKQNEPFVSEYEVAENLFENTVDVFKDAIGEIEAAANQEAVEQSKSLEYNLGSNANDGNNVSEVFSEEINDEKNKKVQFSVDNIGIAIDLHSNENYINSFSSSHSPNETLSMEAINRRSSLTFLPARKFLISDADESWPQDIEHSHRIITPKISRSITSLGKIFENNDDHEESQSNSSMPNSDSVDSSKQTNVKDALIEEELVVSEMAKHKKYDSHEMPSDKTINVSIKKSADHWEAKLGSAGQAQINKDFKEFVKPVTGNDNTLHFSDFKTNEINPSEVNSELKQNQVAQTHQPKQSLGEMKENIIETEKKHTMIPHLLQAHLKNDFKEFVKPIIDYNNSLHLPNLKINAINRSEHNSELKLNQMNQTHKPKQSSGEMKENIIEPEKKHTMIPHLLPTAHFEQSTNKGYTQMKKIQINNQTKMKEENNENITGSGKKNAKLPNLLDTEYFKHGAAPQKHEIHRWCRDMELVIKNLESWRNWIDESCMTISDMYNAEKDKCITSRSNYLRNWAKLQNDIDADAKFWGKMSTVMEDKIKLYGLKNGVHTRKATKVAVLSTKCNCKNIIRKTRSKITVVRVNKNK